MSQRAPGSTVTRMVANAMNILNIEVETGWTREEIVELAKDEGYAINAANQRFQKVAKAKPPVQGIVRTATETSAGAVSAPTVDVPDEPSAAPAPALPIVTSIREGLAHDVPRVRQAAERARDALDRLTSLLTEENGKAAARKRVADLRAQLAEAEAALRGTKPAAAPQQPRVAASTSTIRLWAREQGMDVPERGTLKQAVIDAYQRAHQAVAS